MSARCNQLCVRSGFGYAAVLHDMDHIGMHGRGKAVCDHQRRMTGGQFAEPTQPVGFGPGIHGAGRFVQGDDRGIAQKGPRQRHPLPLADAQLRPAEPFSQQRIITLGQFFDGQGRPRRQRCGMDAGRIRPGAQIAHGDVFGSSRMITHRLLEEHRDPAAQLGRVEPAQVHPVQQDRPLAGIVEPTEQLDQGAFPGAVVADDGGRLPGGKREREVRQGVPLAAGIAEGDVVEADALPQRRRHRLRLCRRRDAGGLGQKQKQVVEKQCAAVDAPGTLHQRAQQFLPLLEGLVAEHQITQPHQTPGRPQEHPDHAGDASRQGNTSGGQFRPHLIAGQRQATRAQTGAQLPEHGLVMAAQIKEPHLGSAVTLGQHPVVITGAAFIGGIDRAPAVFA